MYDGDDEHWQLVANQNFDERMAGKAGGDHLDPSIPATDLKTLRSKAASVKKFVDEHVAHADGDGKPTFPALHDEGPVKRGSVPSFHGFRHTAASYAISGGDSAEDVSWQLGHRHSGITRQVYIQEIKTAERRAQMRAKMEYRYGPLLEAMAPTTRVEPESAPLGEVADFRAARESD
jgi:hypothetical protein